MCFVQNDHMIFEQIRISDTLPHKNTISNVPQLRLCRCLIIESNRIPNLLAQRSSSFGTDTTCHADSCHTTRLGYNDIDLINRRLSSLSVVLDVLLALEDTLAD